MIHTHGVPVAAVVVCRYAVIVLLLCNSLSMGLMMDSMVSLLLVVMALLLVHPGRFLRVLVLVRKHMVLRIHHLRSSGAFNMRWLRLYGSCKVI